MELVIGLMCVYPLIAFSIGVVVGRWSKTYRLARIDQETANPARLARVDAGQVNQPTERGQLKRLQR